MIAKVLHWINRVIAGHWMPLTQKPIANQIFGWWQRWQEEPSSCLQVAVKCRLQSWKLSRARRRSRRWTRMANIRSAQEPCLVLFVPTGERCRSAREHTTERLLQKVWRLRGRLDVCQTWLQEEKQWQSRRPCPSCRDRLSMQLLGWWHCMLLRHWWSQQQE